MILDKHIYFYSYFINLYISQAVMTTTIKQQVIPQNLYEIPSCTICLQQLSSELVSLDCGHIFHVGCISQHFQYKGTCPNCQKRAYQKQIRQIHFPLIQNNKANARLRTLLSSLELSERKQVELLLKEVKEATQLSQKLLYDKVQNEKQIKNQSKSIEHLREQLNKKKSQVEILRRENIKLDTNCQGMSEELNLREKNQIRLRIQLQKCRKDQKEYQQVKKYKKLMSDNSQEIVKYREQLQLKGTPIEEIFKIFFDMLMMKNLQVLKMKDRVREYPQKLSDKEFQISKLKGNIDVMKKEAKQANEKRIAERKKYDELKNKFRMLSDKAKLKGLRQNDIPQMQQSQGFMNLTKNYHIPEDPIVQNTLRKPLFNSTSTIGGLMAKKKDDKMKIYS